MFPVSFSYLHYLNSASSKFSPQFFSQFKFNRNYKRSEVTPPTPNTVRQLVCSIVNSGHFLQRSAGLPRPARGLSYTTSGLSLSSCVSSMTVVKKVFPMAIHCRVTRKWPSCHFYLEKYSLLWTWGVMVLLQASGAHFPCLPVRSNGWTVILSPTELPSGPLFMVSLLLQIESGEPTAWITSKHLPPWLSLHSVNDLTCLTDQSWACN